MFNNYAIVQGVDHIIPVDIYLPGCPPRPQMLLNAIIEPAPPDRDLAARRQPRGGGQGRRGRCPLRHADAPDEGSPRMSDGEKKDDTNAVNADTTKDQASGLTPREIEPGPDGRRVRARGRRRPPRHVRGDPGRRHDRLLRPRPPDPRRRRLRAPLRRLLRRDRRQPRARPRRGHRLLRGGRRPRRRRPGRDDGPRPPRAPAGRGPRAARRRVAALRDRHRRLGRALPEPHR